MACEIKSNIGLGKKSFYKLPIEIWSIFDMALLHTVGKVLFHRTF